MVAESKVDVQAIIDEARAYIDSRTRTIKDFISSSINGVGTGITNIVSAIQNAVSDTLKTLAANFATYLNDVLDTIDDYISTALNLANDVLTQIKTSVSSALESIADFTNDIISVVKNEIEDLIDSAINVVEILVDTVADNISNLMNNIGESIGESYETLTRSISSIATNVSNSIADTYNTVTAGVISLTENASNVASEIYNSLTFAVSETIQETGDYLDALTTNVSEMINGFVDSTLENTVTLFDKVGAGVNDVLEGTNEIIKSFQVGIEDFIQSTITVAGETLTSLIEVVADLPAEIQNLTNELIESAKENIAIPIGDLSNDFIKTISNSFGETSDEDNKRFNNILSGVSKPKEEGLNTIEQVQDFINRNMPLHEMLKSIVNVILTPLLLISLMSGINAVNAKNMMHDYSLETPSELLTPADLVDALRKSNITEEKFTTNLKMLGYFPEDIKVLAKLGRQLLPIDELITIWLRDLITEEQLDFELKNHGITESDTEHLKRAAFFIPPAQDLITMAVREVFSPEIAERFGQFEDFPEDFALWAEKQGISEVWAKNYWAAHWNLPSPQMGFQMLHRGVIDDADLNLLMKSLDVMPFWRDKLQEISYNPLTRVDVRRMHKLGVLSYEEIIQSYKDIGYNQTNATRLADFTELYNAENVEDDEIELNTLTRSNVTKMYKNGILDRNTAIQMLLGLNYSPDAAELYLYEIDVDTELNQREALGDLIISQNKTGQLTFDEAQDKIAALGFEAVETQLLINKLVTAKENKPKLPSVSDLNKFYLSGIIDDAVFLHTMQLLQYSEIWGARYLLLLQPEDVETEVVQEKTKELSRSSIIKVYGLGLIDRKTAVNMLYEIGYELEDIELLITAEELKTRDV